MLAAMKLLAFPTFDLTAERRAALVASLDGRKLRRTDNDILSVRFYAGVQLEMICKSNPRKRRVEDWGRIDDFTDLCTKKTFRLMNSYVIEDCLRITKLPPAFKRLHPRAASA